MLCRIMYYVQLAQEDADRGRHAFCMGPEEVSRGADKIGVTRGPCKKCEQSLRNFWAV